MANKTLTWHGHANFQISTSELNIIIDPWFEGNPSATVGSDACGEIDLVLVTHDHDDHLGQTLKICSNTGAHVMAVVETAQKLAKQGLPADQVVNGIGFNIGGTVQFKGIEVTMVQAFHSSFSGMPVGYIICLEDGYCIYHAGDTGVFSDMKLFGQMFDIDLALLPTGGVFTMDPRQAALACNLLQCKSVVPMHWGSLPILEQNTDKFQEELKKAKAQATLVTMKPGQTIDL